MKKELIIISVPFARNVRYLLSSAIYQEIKRRYAVLIISPFSSQESFKCDFGGDKVSFVSIPEKKMNKLCRGLYTLSELSRTNGYFLRYRSKLKYYWKQATSVNVNSEGTHIKKSLRQKIIAYLTGCLGYFGWSWQLLDRIFGQLFYNTSDLERYIWGYQKCIIIQTANFDYQERCLSYFARKNRLISIFLPYTTDQFIMNGYLINEFDLICPQGPIETEYASHLHKIPSNRIIKVGMLWFRNLERLRGDIQLPAQGKKRILYAGLSSSYYKKSSEFQAIDAIIAHFIKNNINNTQIIYRPVANEEELHIIQEKYLPYSEYINIETPQLSFIGMYTYSTESVHKDIQEYLSTINSIDIMLMSGSTTMLFDAMFFNKPVIACYFNSNSHIPTLDIKMAIEYDVLNIYKSGLPVAFDEKDLLYLCKKYLDNPEFYSQIKDNILNDWDYKNDDYVSHFITILEELIQ